MMELTGMVMVDDGRKHTKTRKTKKIFRHKMKTKTYDSLLNGKNIGVFQRNINIKNGNKFSDRQISNYLYIQC